MRVKPIGMLDRLRRSWQRSMQRRRTLNELAACPPQELNRIASDVGLSGDQLRQHCRRDHGASELLPQRLQLLGIDPEFLRQEAPALFNDLVRVCASCRAAGRCARDLGAGDAQTGMAAYCPNAPTIDLLTASRSHAVSAVE